jgi:predicted helicase
MCVIGNPPYSGIYSNNGKWISNLIEDYKYVDGVHFNERKHWLNDDYVKFLRYGQHYIEKNGKGVLAFINPHGFLDNPTFRGMRWHLLKTYDKIYTIDLHGNSKKKETAPDGSADVNVFDIMQGVSINVFIKTGKKKSSELGKVFHYDLFGKRDAKYNFLIENDFKRIDFNQLKPKNPYLFFVPKNEDATQQYLKGFSIESLFRLNKIGICTQRDSIAIQTNKEELMKILSDLVSLDNEEFRVKYNERPDGRDWKISTARINVENTNCDEKHIRKINYRVFDKRWTYYTNKSKGFMSYPRYETLRHLLGGKNLALVLPRQLAMNNFRHLFITNEIFDQCFISNLTKEGNYAFPLYLYPETNGQQTIEQSSERTPNLNLEIVKEIGDKLGLEFNPNPVSPFEANLYTQLFVKQ